MIVSTTIKLANMEDVDFSSSPTPGQILTLNENGKWVAKTDTLSNNDDIDLTGGISANQVLAFDAVLEKWVPKDPVLVQDYYATSLEIDGNGLLTATITNEVDGDTKIVNTTINLNNLGDVSIPSNPSIGDILSYGATGFSPTANLIKNATDVFYETPRNNACLVWEAENERFTPSQGILPEFEETSAQESQIFVFSGGKWTNQFSDLNLNSDVQYSGISDGKVLIWATDKFVESPGILPTFEITSVEPGQVLIRQGDKFVNVDLNTSLLSDIDLADLEDGSLLRFNSLLERFETYSPPATSTNSISTTTTELSSIGIENGVLTFESSTPEYISFF